MREPEGLQPTGLLAGLLAARGCMDAMHGWKGPQARCRAYERARCAAVCVPYAKRCLSHESGAGLAPSCGPEGAGSVRVLFGVRRQGSTRWLALYQSKRDLRACEVTPCDIAQETGTAWVRDGTMRQASP